MINTYRKRITDFVREHKKGIKAVIFLFVVGTMAVRGLMQIPQISASKAEIARLTSRIEYEKGRQKEVEELKTQIDTDEYIEKIASEKLGFVKSNSKIFVDVSGE